MKTFILDLSACDVYELNKSWFNGYTEEIPCEACDGGNWEFYVRPRSVPADVMDRWRKRSGQMFPELKLGFDFTALPEGAAMQIVSVIDEIVVLDKFQKRVDELQSAINELRDDMRAETLNELVAEMKPHMLE